ncbi:unnamed protein product [Lactuca saligna]|uniref:RNase H type-1 domain-containing protein n=1 Tax=Lactuca saligna TaxID=75948 RepID=A0AA36EP92_LACSI|nr:unnamed protein product [Lactuca saligna]
MVDIPGTFSSIPKALPVYPLEPEASKDVWELHTDGVASKQGSGAGLILKNPMGDEITYALRFDFQVSNNEAKYKAILEGLRLAQEVGTKLEKRFDVAFPEYTSANNITTNILPKGRICNSGPTMGDDLEVRHIQSITRRGRLSYHHNMKGLAFGSRPDSSRGNFTSHKYFQHNSIPPFYLLLFELSFVPLFSRLAISPAFV